MFQGAANLSLDAKGRMTIPTRHRDALQMQSEGRLTFTKHPHGCLLMFPRPVWESHREEIAKWPLSAKGWQRIFLGSAMDVEMDGAGRVLISPELRDAAGLAKDVTMMGMGSHFEIWDAQALGKHQDDTIAAGMPPALEHFSF
jgi:MraZ protein